MKTLSQVSRGRPASEIIEGLLSFLLLLLVLVTAVVLVTQNWDIISAALTPNKPVNFDHALMSNENKFIQLETGQYFHISYETKKITTFAGRVRHISPIDDVRFDVLTYDILVTSGDFADPAIVNTNVINHKYTWYAPHTSQPTGTIGLLHTVPINQKINDQLSEIENGDTVIIKGYEILRISGYDANGNYVGYWEDAGCHTTLITEVIITSNQ